MEYDKLSKEELIAIIEELQILNQQLLLEKEQEDRLDFSWTGNLGHWYWNTLTNRVTFNKMKVNALGYSMDEIPEHVNYQFFTDKIHPEDHKKTMDAMLDHLYGKKEVYEVEYRIKAKDGSYKWFYDRGKITKFDKSNKPIFLSGIVFDITDKKELEEQLAHKNKKLQEQVNRDGLTKLYNHSTIIEFLKTNMQEADKKSIPLSIVMFDIDNFKKVNDNYGHVMGDKVIKDIAKIIKKNVRETDLVGRYGGEEYLIILPNTKKEDAMITAERIRIHVKEHEFGEDIKVTISGGLKQFEKERLVEYINEADKKLYEAKKTGKNKIC